MSDRPTDPSHPDDVDKVVIDEHLRSLVKTREFTGTGPCLLQKPTREQLQEKFAKSTVGQRCCFCTIAAI